MKHEFLFVYGTLRQQAGHPLHRHLCLYAVKHTEAHMQGCLFEVAGYPGAIESPSPDHWVKGELYRILDSKRLFAILDDYEECSNKHPRPHEYRRKKVAIHCIRGDTVSAWAYIYNRPTTRLRKIATGNYLCSQRRA